MGTPLRVAGTVLGAPHAATLAGFYARLTGWPIVHDEGDWTMLADPRGGAGLSFQTEADYQRPVWPAGPGQQQMSMHLDLAVDDLAAAVAEAEAAGATLATHQPQDDVRVMLDPAGHPFCLFVGAEQPAALVRRYLAAFATGDPRPVLDCVADDFVNEHTAALGSGCSGKAAYAERLPGFLASMADLRYEVHDVVAERGRAAATYTLHATVGGRPVAVPGCMHFEIAGGLITRRTDYWDSLVFQRQAGLA